MIHWIVYALVSALFFSIKDVIAKDLFSHHEMNATHAVMQEYFVYLLLTSILFFRIDFSAVFTMWPLLLGKAITLAIIGYLYFHLLEKHEISMVAPVMILSPLFLLLFSFMFLGEGVSLLQIIGVVSLVVATYYLEVVLRHHDEDNAHKAHFWKLERKDGPFFLSVIVLLVVVSFTAIFDKILLKSISWETNLFFMGIFVLTFYTIWKKPLTLVKSIELYHVHPKTIVFSLFNTLSTIFVLLAIAVPSALVSLVIPLRRTSTLFSALFGGLLFHEKHLFKKLGSIVVMLVGIIFLLM